MYKNYTLIYKLINRDVVSKYKGSSFGLFWSFFNPIMMLAVYTIFFGIIFKARWVGVQNTKEFALILFSGLLVFNLFSECINRSSTLILSNVNYVKKVVFPLEVLPIVIVGSACFHFFVSLIVWCGFAILVMGGLNWTILFVPFIILPFLVLVLGFCWTFAALGVYLRDTAQVLGLLVMASSFMSPIFYPVDVLPIGLRELIHINPLTFIIEQMRAVMYFGVLPDFVGLFLYSVCSLCVFFVGFYTFEKLRKGFADVL